jgi:hypothetical protein
VPLSRQQEWKARLATEHFNLMALPTQSAEVDVPRLPGKIRN